MKLVLEGSRTGHIREYRIYVKHLLKINIGRYVNAFLVTGNAFVDIDSVDQYYVIKIPDSQDDRGSIYVAFEDEVRAHKECDRINEWLEQFIDYEAEGLSK